uniref:START domain-containing protein n=1 Tax=Heterorhabditis bacteriophora TaxID=37862 RepID=A0A1I7XMA6_HETBA
MEVLINKPIQQLRTITSDLGGIICLADLMKANSLQPWNGGDYVLRQWEDTNSYTQVVEGIRAI